jgi:non-ribosomal peptide synthase protein (TIGR01720 family)
VDELNKRIANLSPAKRAFLDQRLHGLGNKAVIPRKTKQELAPLAFRSDGEGTPLFLFHYLTPSQVLAKHLGPGRPVFGIDSAFEEELYLWEESGRIAVSVEELAGRCRAELQNAQPRGPYFLAGFCFGGVLAFEIAKQLIKRSERVAFLGLLDSFYLPGINPMSVPWLATDPAADRSSDMTEPEKEFLRRVAFMRELVKPYKSDPYPGGAVLFRAMANRDPSDFGTNGWNEVLAEGVQLEDCQSTRMGLFEEPFVVEFAARLAERLSKVDARLRTTGKVGRAVLSGPNQEWPELEEAIVAPRTSVEKVLADIWSQVLRIEQVGVQTKFFQLGGDSILSIQVIAKANKAGLRLTMKQIFQYQTIAELALVAEAVKHQRFEQELVTGEVPLTPIQQWFFEQDYTGHHHWNQAKLLELRQDLEPELLERAIQQLVVYHDALRLRFVRGYSGWRQFNAGAEEAVKLTLVDLTGAPEGEQTLLMESAAAGLQASLNLLQGPVVRAALFELGPGRPRRLLFVIHHLAVDGVSWRILLEDLQIVCQQLQSGETVRMPAKTTSFRNWAQELAEHGHSAALERENAYWLAASSTESGPIPVDLRGGQNTEASARTLSVELDAEETRALLQQVPQAYNTQINDVLLSALGLTLTSWIGQPGVRINLEGHGREELFEGVDLSRTVGWFTTIFPVNLDLRGMVGPGDVLKSVKEQLRRIPQRGIGYGILRYLRGDEPVAAQLRALVQPQVIFNYLGQFDQTAPTSQFVVVEESTGPVHSPLARRSHLLGINSLVTDGRLRVNWAYSEAVHRRSTIERVAQNFMEALRSLIHHCTSPSAGGYTPSDFVGVGLDQEELDHLISQLSEPEA